MDTTPTALASILDLAQTLDEAGEGEHAAALLAEPLRTLDPATTGPDHHVIAAAMLYARTVEPTPDLDPDEIAWAGYARRAARSLHGPDHPATIEAIETLALALHARDRFAEADALRRHLIHLHLDRGDVDAHLFARMDLAQQLHNAGRCGDAIRQATAAWQEWTSTHDPSGAPSLPIGLQLVGMLRACWRYGEADAVAADLHEPSPDEPNHDAHAEFLITLIATGYHHQKVCGRNLDQTLGVAPRPIFTPGKASR